LKCPADAEPNNMMRWEIGNIVRIEKDSSLLGPVKAGNTIQQARFTGSIRPDNRYKFSRMYRNINIMKRLDSAKVQGKVFYLKLGRFFLICIMRIKYTRLSPIRLHKTDATSLM
jgi:hypothetical protein